MCALFISVAKRASAWLGMVWLENTESREKRNLSRQGSGDVKELVRN